MQVARTGQESEPPEVPPRGLLPLLHFTRLPDRALAAARKVLDDDDAFRRRVRAATSEVEVGRASWLLLDRPEGWEDELARLAAGAEEAAEAAEETKAEAGLRRRVGVLESTLDRAAAELARARGELAEAKDQLAGERRGRRQAESEAGRLRREVEDLSGRVHDLGHRESVLQAALVEMEHRRAAPAAEEVEEEPPPPPDVDHAGLAASLAQGIEAARILSNALVDAERLLAPGLDPPGSSPSSASTEAPSPSRSRSRSAGEVRRPAPLPPGTFEDSAEAADHLVRVAGVRVLVDGYNVTKSARPELALADQRRWLTDAAVELAARTGAKVELVFDGTEDRASAPANLGRRHEVQVRFTAEGVEADDVLLDLVEALPLRVPVVVASDDRRVRDGARRRGANVVSTAQLLSVLGRSTS